MRRVGSFSFVALVSILFGCAVATPKKEAAPQTIESEAELSEQKLKDLTRSNPSWLAKSTNVDVVAVTYWINARGNDIETSYRKTIQLYKTLWDHADAIGSLLGHPIVDERGHLERPALALFEMNWLFLPHSKDTMNNKPSTEDEEKAQGEFRKLMGDELGSIAWRIAARKP